MTAAIPKDEALASSMLSVYVGIVERTTPMMLDYQKALVQIVALCRGHYPIDTDAIYETALAALEKHNKPHDTPPPAQG